MFVLGRCCICLYLQIFANLGVLCFSRTDGSITTTSPALSVPNPTHLRVRCCLLISEQNFGLGRALSFLGLLDGLTGEGEPNISVCADSPSSAQGSQQPGSDVSSLLTGGCTSYWSGMDARNSNPALLRNPGALFGCSLCCSINQKNLHCDCKLFKVLSSVHPLSSLD